MGIKKSIISDVFKYVGQLSQVGNNNYVALKNKFWASRSKTGSQYYDF
jgi:hypothetical protein